MRNRVRGFERGNDAFGFREGVESGERFVVGRVNVFNPAGVAQVTVLRSDRGVIEPGGNRMCELDMPVFVREQK